MKYNADKIWHKLRRRSKPTTTSVFDFPDPSQCTVHLRLLRAFSCLREDVVDSLRDQVLPTTQDGVTADDMDNLVWERFVDRASERFEVWWRTIAPHDTDGNLYQIDSSVCLQPGRLESLLRDTRPMTWTREDLPPLDVLMIFHSYMLNPRCFLEDCIRYGMVSMWKAGMPWDLVDDALTPDTNEYDAHIHTQNSWTHRTSLPWVSTELSTGLPNRARAQLQAVHRAVDLLKCKDIPLPGTILGVDGLAESATQPDQDPPLFKFNRVMQGDLGSRILIMTSDDELEAHPSRTVKDVKATIEMVLGDNMTPELRKALNRATLKFSDTPSPFALNLSAAVQRQFAFTHKMQDIDWLHSPFLPATLSALLTRYRVFFAIMAADKNQVAVPTHAVDLAWHTHQLSPLAYYAFSTRQTGGVFVDHDDRIAEAARDDAFAWTTDRYHQVSNGKEYGACLCWYCAGVAHMLGSKRDADDVFPRDAQGHFDTTSRPEVAGRVAAEIARAQYERLQDDYGWACRRAEWKGGKAPDRAVFLREYAWPYPAAIPVVEA